MASLITLSLLPILLFTILSPTPTLCYVDSDIAGVHHVATGSSTYIILVEPPPTTSAEGEHRRWHESFLPSLHTDDGNPRLLHSYTEVFSGFTARLTDTELEVVARKPGFVRAFPDRRLGFVTTHTPEFLGLRNGTGLWSEGGYGKGVIIGFLDSGIDAAHPSFDDRGVSPPPARWKGSCTAARCNNKLIGAKSLVGGDSSDDFGHGTHTSSTAAGNFVAGASAYGVRVGTAAGTAPHAHIAMYKVGDASGSDESVVLAGLDAAIKDGVDVVSLSMEGDESHFDQDPIAIGAFSAISKGIVVVCSAGNSGPKMGTVANDAPWLLTVAAGSVDRSFGVSMRLGNGKRIDGEALKPDILAPGLNILAAWPRNVKHGPGAFSFNIQSGTSMASPHVSGVAALIKSSHPDWSPAAIKSAIMTTSDALDNTGGLIMDEQHRRAGAYATGAGHVNPTRANDPGLVFDLGVADYAGYICELLGDHALSVIVRNSTMTCKNLPKVSEAQLNYPTITVPMKPTPFTLSRTVTNVGPAESTYTVEVEAPRSLIVHVFPEMLDFSKIGEKKTFDVSVSSSRNMEEGELLVEASLSWVSEKHIVRSPIVVVANLGRPPPS
nr:LOW QUALITY PROTEIN: subtilisin-like protease 1 [Lolium perenne]